MTLLHAEELLGLVDTSNLQTCDDFNKYAELRDAVCKQASRKYLYDHELDSRDYVAHCPRCEFRLDEILDMNINFRYCPNCGQKIVARW